MEISIGEHIIDLYERITVNLKFDCAASTFSMLTYFDPNNPVHKSLFMPGAYHPCTITHGGAKLLTGIVTSVQFGSAGGPPKTLVQVGGYSRTGVLEDCPVVRASADLSGLGLKKIAEEVCGHYNIKVIVDPEVAGACNTPFTQSTPKIDEPVRAYLDRLASHVNVVLSHDSSGNLVLTKAKSDKALTTSLTAVKSPVAFSDDISGAPEDIGGGLITSTADRPVLYHFGRGTPNTQMLMTFNGQRIHSDIVVLSQYDGSSDDTTPDVLFNPYFKGSVFLQNFNQFNRQAYQIPTTVRGLRPRTVLQREQSESSDNEAPKTARMVLGEELKGITLNISTDRWVLDGNIITPNQIVSVMNPDVYLYKETEWFIQEVTLTGTATAQTAEIQCVPTDAFNDDKPKNIFDE